MGLDQFQNIVNGGVNGLISKITRPYRLAIMICKELVRSRSNVLLVSRKGLKYLPCGFVAYDRVEPQQLSEDRMPQTREMHGMRRVPQGEQRQDPVLSEVHGRGKMRVQGDIRAISLETPSTNTFIPFPVKLTPGICRTRLRTRTGPSLSVCSRPRVRRIRPRAGSLCLWRTWTSS